MKRATADARWLVLAATVLSGCAGRLPPEALAVRDAAMDRAAVWAPVPTPQMDLWSGPRGPQAFAPNALVACEYVERESRGNTPKFSCRLPGGDIVKVKYGRENGEVYAEVAATRLLWALGFGADAMYPVRVRCHGCPGDVGARPATDVYREYEVAIIERPMRGRPIEGLDGDGWAWPELDRGSERHPELRPQRDALKLLAAFIQHTDSKAEQQRALCLDARPSGRCRRPFLMIGDLGKTFGRANALNRDAPSSVNLEGWRETPVWADVDTTGCRANLARSLTGTLDYPLISEAGRRFLLRLLQQLSERQLRDLFAASRFPMRDRTASATDAREIEAWVSAFHDKVAQVARHSCGPAARAAESAGQSRR